MGPYGGGEDDSFYVGVVEDLVERRRPGGRGVVAQYGLEPCLVGVARDDLGAGVDELEIADELWTPITEPGYCHLHVCSPRSILKSSE